MKNLVLLFPSTLLVTVCTRSHLRHHQGKGDVFLSFFFFSFFNWKLTFGHKRCRALSSPDVDIVTHLLKKKKEKNSLFLWILYEDEAIECIISSLRLWERVVRVSTVWRDDVRVMMAMKKKVFEGIGERYPAAHQVDIYDTVLLYICCCSCCSCYCSSG